MFPRLASTPLLRFFCILAVTGGSYATYLMACENHATDGPKKTAPLKITTTSLPAATAGVAYTDTLHATGGTGGDQWGATDEFPSWLSLSPAGILTGTPPDSADTSKETVALVVTDVTDDTVLGQFTLTVYPSGTHLTITTTSPLPQATAGTAYSDQLHATGGTGTYQWSLATGDALPAGLTLSAAGLLSGTPTTAAADTFSVNVTSGTSTASQHFSLTVNAATLTITTASPLPQATAGTAYSEQFAASGGTGSYSWYPVSVPAGLSLSPAGLLSGTPTTADVGTQSVQLQVTSGSATVNGTFSLPVVASTSGSCTVTSPTSAVPTIHDSTQAPYYTFNTTCGAIGYTNWSLAAGALPTGVTINTIGTITGMATSIPVINGPQRTTYSFTLSVTGTQGPTGPSQTGSAAFTVQGSPFFISGIQGFPAIPNFTIGQAYSYQFVDKNGFGSTYDTWSITNNPAWVSISSSGLLTGTPPTGSTSQSFTVRVITAKGSVADTVSDNVNWYPN